ncbi:MAG: Rpn family recombination-promoting nuclease/putative transposase [Oscillatoriales cyanobacterium RU_3_3]|nr:Rpn family recombination-promoting nuclease/putative transposase [Oscillatoriales cyanobacterium RU_3_3]NJR23700.1 Rpn family recombination-promoting nuclease/putative transposase [Richelia sp. CSU_2_1]
MSFINPKIDFAFKKIFGSNESREILISFLNAMLYAGEPVIEDLEIIAPYLSAQIFGSKDTYLDVKAKINDGRIVIIEMQVLNVPAFGKRVLYNAAKTYALQLNRGDRYYRLRQVIALNITDFEMFPNQSEVISRFAFKETQRLFNYPDSEIELVFIELPKFNKELSELITLTDKWIYFIKNTSNLESVPETMGTVPEIERAFQIANDANLNQKELDELQQQEFWIQDQQGAIDLGIQQGIQQGIEQGRQQGIKQGKVGLIVRQLIRLVGEISPDIQMRIDELNLDELENLGEAMFDFTSISDLLTWLQEHSV